MSQAELERAAFYRNALDIIYGLEKYPIEDFCHFVITNKPSLANELVEGLKPQNTNSKQEFIDDGLQPWQRLDQVTRQWAVMSQHNQVMENYENLRNSN